MADALKKFGKYFLLDLIAQGGMAEIYRARMATPDGGGRLLAIKRILASYSQNTEFVSMFKAEIKTTSGFTHPNIVSLYDYGEEEKMLYIAMEYVDGRNLRQFITRFTEMKTLFPVEVSVYIMEQVAHGMAYAHNYKDKFSGKNLNIVHRDISPQNIIISYDGAVKVIDFGIAKAVTNSDSTRAGVIKGKPSYLSPEQISGEVLDGRSDIFALGAVFWELLSGRKLFQGENDYAVIKLIESCNTFVKPPSLYNPKVPKELDAIVMKCLIKDREQRFQSSEELQRALHKFLYQFSSDFNPADLAYYARDTFKNEIVEDRKRLLALNERVEQFIAMNETDSSAIEREKTKHHLNAILPAKSVEDKEKTSSGQRYLNMTSESGESSGSFREIDLKQDSTVSAVKLERAVTDKHQVKVGDFPAASTSENYSKSNLRQSQNLKQPSPRPVRRANSTSPAVAVALVALVAGGYWFYTTQNETAAVRMTAADKAAERGTGVLIVEGNVSLATVMIDGRVVGQTLPLEVKELPNNRTLTLTISSNGFKKHTQEINLKDRERQRLGIDLEREQINVTEQDLEKRSVALRVAVTPLGLGTVIKLNGLTIDSSGVTTAPINTPLELVVEREGFVSTTKTFTIPETAVGTNSDYTVNVSLNSLRFGYLSIKTTPSADAILTINGKEERIPTPIARKKIPIGTYKVRLVNDVLGMEKEITVKVEEERFASIEERLSVEVERRPANKNRQ